MKLDETISRNPAPMTVQDNHAARPLGVERFNTPFYRLLRILGLFGPSRRINRWLYRVRTQRRALAGQGLVPEQKLTASLRPSACPGRRCGEAAGHADERRVEPVEVGAQHGRGVAGRVGGHEHHLRRFARSASSSRVIAEATCSSRPGRCRGSWCSRRRPASGLVGCRGEVERLAVGVGQRASGTSYGWSRTMPL